MPNNLLITHDPAGEYTRHLRHEETSRAVIKLWYDEKIFAHELRTFAYEDGGKAYFPRPIKNANIFFELPKKNWQKKYIRDGINKDIIEVLPVGCDTDAFILREKNDPKISAVRESLGVSPEQSWST